MEKQRTTVLIVDDDRNNIQILEGYLKTEGYDVISVDSGKEALRILIQSDKHIKVVLLDRIMPHISGTAVSRVIKSNNDLKDIQVIMQTSMIKPQDIVSGTEAGADRYLAKPIDEKLLLSTVRASVRDYDRFHQISTENVQLKNRTTILREFLAILEEQSDDPSPMSLLSRLRVNMREVMKIKGDPQVTFAGLDKPEGIYHLGDTIEICSPPFTVLLDADASEEQQANVYQMITIMAKHIQAKTQEAAAHRLQKQLKDVISSAGKNTLNLVKEIDETGDEMSKEQILQKMKLNLLEILVTAGHSEMEEDLERLRMGAMKGEVNAQDQQNVDDLLAQFGM